MHYRPRYVLANPGPRVDEEITHERVTVIDESGKRLGQMPTADAIQLARSRGFSLLELAPGVGRFGRTSKPSTMTRPMANRTALFQLKEQFGTRMSIPEDTEQAFPYEQATGQWVWIRLQPLEEHIKQILEIPQHTSDSPTVHLWDISRKVVDQKKQELLKEQTKKSDEIIALSKKVAGKSGVNPQLLNSYFEDPRPPAAKKKPALIALSVVGRRALADAHCGPTVCLGRFIGNQRKLGYIGMWWKNHVWAFVDPETQTGRQLNFKTQAPEFDEVVSYDNGPSYVTAEDEAQALEIARRWMPQAKELAQYFEERTDTASEKLDVLEDELSTIQYKLQQVRIMEAYQTWRRSGKPIRLEHPPQEHNVYSSLPNRIIGSPDYLFMPAEERNLWNRKICDIDATTESVVANEAFYSSIIVRYGLMVGRLEQVNPFVCQQVKTTAEENFEKAAIHRMNVWYNLCTQLYGNLWECLRTFESTKAPAPCPRIDINYDLINLQKLLKSTCDLSHTYLKHRYVRPFQYDGVGETNLFYDLSQRIVPTLRHQDPTKLAANFFGESGRNVRALMGIKADGSSVLRELTNDELDLLADETFEAYAERASSFIQERIGLLELSIRQDLLHSSIARELQSSIAREQVLLLVETCLAKQKQLMRTVFRQVYQILRQAIQTWAPYNDLPLFGSPHEIPQRFMDNLRIKALDFYGLRNVNINQFPLTTLRRIVTDRELEYLHGPHARAQLNPGTRYRTLRQKS